MHYLYSRYRRELKHGEIINHKYLYALAEFIEPMILTRYERYEYLSIIMLNLVCTPFLCIGPCQLQVLLNYKW